MCLPVACTVYVASTKGSSGKRSDEKHSSRAGEGLDASTKGSSGKRSDTRGPRRSQQRRVSLNEGLLWKEERSRSVMNPPVHRSRPQRRAPLERGAIHRGTRR
mgnify:CR=1 FL=1